MLCFFSTRRLHHARPELRLFVQRVAVGAVQLVDVYTWCCGQTAVMADKHVKRLYGRKKKNTQSLRASQTAEIN